MTINKKFMHKKNYLFLLVLITIFSISCMDKSGLQQTNTYPVEIFSEMHYSQAYKSQEPPRLEPAKSSVVFQKSSDETLPDSKKLNTDIWYDEETKLWVKAAFDKTGYWELTVVHTGSGGSGASTSNGADIYLSF